jgi:TolB-like protein/tetratricopeptide (TPR) repeat protein
MIYRFGDFALDSAIFELRKRGQPVAIEPQVFSVLLHLIRNRDQVVSKDDLIATIWEGRAVSDTTLSSRIFALRRVLGDSGEAQAVIRTSPRRGFRFLADVSTEGGHETAKAETSDAVTEDPGKAISVAPPLRQPRSATVDQYPATVMPVLMVLPFKNASPGLDQYFCDGLTEDIISNLTHFSEIRVIASGTSLRFKDRDLIFADIAAEVGADYIVDGSVRRDGERLRTAVHLVDAHSGVSLWADRYDRQTEDIFAVQDAVTNMIVASLGVKTQTVELTRALRKSPSDLDAYGCLLRARRYTATLNEEMHAEARDLLEKAIRLDPNYAEAYALLANVYLAEYRFDANPRPDPIGRALKMALRATQLDPQSAFAHCWLAIVHYFQRDNGKFETEAQRALDLNPNDPEILAEVGHYLSYMGEFARGIELSKRAIQLNPLHPGWYHFSFARLHYHQRRYEDMLVDIQRISMPNFYWTHLLDAAALGQLGRAEASRSLALMHAAKPGVSAVTEMRKWNVAPRDFDHILEGLRKAGHDE